MRSPGRVVAEWVADDPRRNDLSKPVGRIGRALDLVWYTVTVNVVAVLVALMLVLFAVALLVPSANAATQHWTETQGQYTLGVTWTVDDPDTSADTMVMANSEPGHYESARVRAVIRNPDGSACLWSREKVRLGLAHGHIIHHDVVRGHGSPCYSWTQDGKPQDGQDLLLRHGCLCLFDAWSINRWKLGAYGRQQVYLEIDGWKNRHRRRDIRWNKIVRWN